MTSVFTAGRVGGRTARLIPGLLLAVLALAAPAAQAQPFSGWTVFSGPTSGYVEIPHSPALNPTAAFTFEAWVNVKDPGGCASIAGKNWIKAWWVGICGTTLRSYVRGNSTSTGGGPGTYRDAGDLPPFTWTHIAVVFNGTTRLHYINGELAGSWPEPGPLTTTTDPVRIGSDVSYVHTPNGAMLEIRLWNVARTQAQIRAAINVPITAAQPGLVAVWPLAVTDVVGSHSGTIHGSGVGGLSFPPGGSCTTTATTLCLQGRFIVSAKWRTNPTPGTRTDGDAKVVVAGANSGIFWFFSSDNWELMVKALNGCGLNSRYWLFSAATTNVFYRLDVFDQHALTNKVYFNYPGPPAPALTDTSAFATCP